jgi:hypothetical protein
MAKTPLYQLSIRFSVAEAINCDCTHNNQTGYNFLYPVRQTHLGTARAKAAKLARKIKYIEIACEPAFTAVYAESMLF